MTTDVLALSVIDYVKAGHLSGLFLYLEPRTEISISQSKARKIAEAEFTRNQSQLFAKNKANEELDHIAIAREEKTARLREARLAKEENDRTSAVANLLAKRKNKATID